MSDNKHWIEKTLSHEETGAVSYDFMFSPLINCGLRDHYKADDLAEYLNFPIRSCGSFWPIIPDMIDIGLDILHPIQPEAMDILKLKREFGADITFCGGIPTQYLLNDGTPEEVRSEVRRLKREMGKGGGYILEPGITLQADIPFENVLALIEEARR